MNNRSHSSREVNAGSMADIAFLLLIFFLVTTQITQDHGIPMRLPPAQDTPVVPLNERNVFTIQLNSQDELLVEKEAFTNIALLRGRVKDFIDNRGRNPNLSDSPEKAVVSIKTDRGTTYERYIEILDEVMGAYYELRAEQAGVSPAVFRQLKLSNPADRQIYEKGKEGLPMQISIAEPTNSAGIIQ